MQKIILIGSGGSGKSTLARDLGTRLNIDVHHLDAFLWKPNWTPATRQEQITIQSELIEHESWILDGNYGGTLDLRLSAADTIIFLDLPRTVCTYRVLKRMLSHRGKTRPDMGDGCEEWFDLKFLKWVWDYPKSQRPDVIHRLHGLPDDKRVIMLHSRTEVRDFITRVGTEQQL
ncbi:DNA topology modulation protein [Exiguobacterium sp. TNDT2]|uniref:DNA topology modulation protein n=1 Tax=Exiguobacterium sp. TNDT2 TaxID=2233531 RepID=UPI000DEF1B34|nr:DNA topology modulation protein [Exiguobacterium sp. TNDT2]